jgi:hypothetical protein
MTTVKQFKNAFQEDDNIVIPESSSFAKRARRGGGGGGGDGGDGGDVKNGGRGWHFSFLTTLLLCVKSTPIDDSDGPCTSNQSDIPREWE